MEYIILTVGSGNHKRRIRSEYVVSVDDVVDYSPRGYEDRTIVTLINREKITVNEHPDDITAMLGWEPRSKPS